MRQYVTHFDEKLSIRIDCIICMDKNEEDGKYILTLRLISGHTYNLIYDLVEDRDSMFRNIHNKLCELAIKEENYVEQMEKTES